MQNPFTHHPRLQGETYFQHAFFALQFGGSLMLGGVACLLHAIFPFLFKTTASDTLMKQMKQYIERQPHPEEKIVTLAHFLELKMGKTPTTAMPLSISMMQMQYESSTD